MVLFSQFLNTKYHARDKIGVDMDDDLPVNSEKHPNISVAVSGS